MTKAEKKIIQAAALGDRVVRDQIIKEICRTPSYTSNTISKMTKDGTAVRINAWGVKALLISKKYIDLRARKSDKKWCLSKIRQGQTLWNLEKTGEKYFKPKKPPAVVRTNAVIIKDDSLWLTYNALSGNMIFHERNERKYANQLKKEYNKKNINILIFVDSYDICDKFIKASKGYIHPKLELGFVVIGLNNPCEYTLNCQLYDLMSNYYDMRFFELFKLFNLLNDERPEKKVICTRLQYEYLSKKTLADFEIVEINC